MANAINAIDYNNAPTSTDFFVEYLKNFENFKTRKLWPLL